MKRIVHSLLFILISLIILFLMLPVLNSLIEDKLVVEKYDFNIIKNIDRIAEDESYSGFLKEDTYEISLFYIKNYNENETEFDISLKSELDECNETNIICIGNQSIIVKTIDKKTVNGHDIVQLLLEIKVNDKAENNNYIFDLLVNNGNYAKKRIHINIGREYFSYGSKLEDENIEYVSLNSLYISISVIGFALAMVVFSIGMLVKRN